MALAGHPEWAKMFDLLDPGYYWKEMWKDLDRYVRKCHDCQWSRSLRHSTFGVLQPLPVADELWEDISMDFVVGLQECEVFDAISVVVDRLSKMRHFIPCHTTIDGLGLAELFLWEVVRLHGLTFTIVSDRGPQFGSTFWQQMYSRLGIDRRTSTAFDSHTDGQKERMNAHMEHYLRVFVNHQQDDWVKWHPLAEFAPNNGVSETTKCTPLDAIHGTDPRISFAVDPTKGPDQRRVGADNDQATMQQIHGHLRAEMRRSQVLQEERTNRGRVPAPNMQEGSHVSLNAQHIRTTRPMQKLDW